MVILDYLLDFINITGLIDKLLSEKSFYKNGKLKEEIIYKKREIDYRKNYYENGQLETEYSFKDGDYEGPKKWYYENGNIREEETYKNNKLNGPFKEYYNSGQLKREGSYKNGNKPNGTWKGYYENGKLKYENNYKNDKEEGLLKSWYENGQLESEVMYTDGKKEGLWKTWYENGQIKYEENYKNDKEEGLLKSWYENGQLENDGGSKWYHENGDVMTKDEGLFILKTEISGNTTKYELRPSSYRLSDLDLIRIKFPIDVRKNHRFKEWFDSEKNKTVIVKGSFRGIEIGGYDWNYEIHYEIKRMIKSDESKKIKDFDLKEKIVKEQTKNNKENSDNPKKRIWNKTLHITKPDELSLLVPTELQKTEYWNYFLDNKPFNGVVYYIRNEQQILNSLDLSDLLMKEEKEKQKLIDYEFDIKDGVKNGKCRMFDEHQNLRMEYEIKNDIKNGIEKEYNVDGKVIYTQLYKDHLRNGLEVSYYDNGKIQTQKEWVNGKCTGTVKFFDQEGVLRTESTYQNGKHVGPQKCWNEIGEEIDCSLTSFQLEEKIISTEEIRLEKMKEEEEKEKELEKTKLDLISSREKDYKKVQDIIDVDVTKLKFHDFWSIGDWFEDVLGKTNNSDYYLILTDYHSRGGYLQFLKSETNKNNKVISEFKDEYDPTGMKGEEEFDNTNDVYENEKGFTCFQIYKVTSEKFPELLKKKIDEFIKENGNENMDGFLEWLDGDIGSLNYESCEIMIDSLGLNRNDDVVFVDEVELNITRDYSTKLDLTTNPLVISYGGYYQSGEHELFLGVIKK